MDVLDALFFVALLLLLERVRVEELLQLLVGVVDAELRRGGQCLSPSVLSSGETPRRKRYITVT